MRFRPGWQIYLLAFAYVLIYLLLPPASGILDRLFVGLVGVAIVLAYRILYERPESARFASTLLVGENQTTEQMNGSLQIHRWLWSGFAFVVLAFFFLETRQPFYFTQDDVIAQSLPNILQGMHSFERGIFPTWDPYQYMGSPTTTIGDYALTYPPTFLSYWIAKHLLRNEYWTVDVFSTMHLLAGYLVTFWAIRREHARPSLAMLGGLCCSLSGFALIVGRSWFHTTPVFVWVPLLIGLSRLVIDRNPDWKWIGACGLAVGLFFHAGNVQMWAYSLLLLVIAVGVLIAKQALPFRRVFAIAAGALLGFGIAFPLLIPELFAVRGLNRTMLVGGILRGLPTLFVPISVMHTMPPFPWGGPYRNVLGEMYYSGTVFCVVGVVLFAMFLAFKWDAGIVRRNIWFICALLALILALGKEGLLWNVLWVVPGFSKFRTAFKFLALFNVFMAVSGAAALERVLRYRRWGLRAELALSLGVVLLLAFHCNLSTGSFWNYAFKPYPQIDPALRNLFEPKNDRDYPKLLPVSAYRSESPHWFDSMYQQWPTLFGFFSFGGYEPLVEGMPEYQHVLNLARDPEALRHLGVRYVIVDKSVPEAWDPDDLALRLFGAPAYGSKLKVAYYSQHVKVFELLTPDKMAFQESAATEPLPVTFDGGGATIDTSEVAGGTIILNMLRRPEIRALAGNREIPVDSDSWYRVRIHLASPAKQIRIEFHPRWELGFLVALAAFIASIIMASFYLYGRASPDTFNLASSADPTVDALRPRARTGLVSSAK